MPRMESLLLEGSVSLILSAVYGLEHPEHSGLLKLLESAPLHETAEAMVGNEVEY